MSTDTPSRNLRRRYVGLAAPPWCGWPWVGAEADSGALRAIVGLFPFCGVARTAPPYHTCGMDLLTTPELARETGYDISTICRWARRGDLPSVRKLPGVTGAWLFDAAVVRPLIAAKTPPAGHPATDRPGVPG